MSPRVEEVPVSELDAAAGVLARGMRDNPVHIAAFGEKEEVRQKNLYHLFCRLLPTMSHPPMCAREGEKIVGVLGLARPGTCQPSPQQIVKVLPAALQMGAVSMFRFLRWQSEWQKHDPDQSHWHVGPLAVEPEIQGVGIGTFMMEWLVSFMDSEGATAYLETERPQNVSFYEKFGFEVTAEDLVLGTPSWYMTRTSPDAESSGRA